MSAINELHALCIELPENTGPFSSADHRCYLAVVHDEDLGYRVLGRQHPFFSATGLMQHICAARAIDTVERMLLVQGRAVSPEAYIQRWRTLLARPRTLDQLAMHDRLRVGASFQWRRRPGQGSVKARWSQPPFVTFGELLQAHGCAAERQDDGNEIRPSRPLPRLPFDLKVRMRCIGFSDGTDCVHQPMSRRNRQGALRAVVDLAARVPWWIGVIVAVIVYLMLHALATGPAAAALKPGQLGTAVLRGAVQAVAGVLQYILPAIVMLGVALSAWHRRQRGVLADNVARINSPDALDGLTWLQFEKVVAEHFAKQGYVVAENGGGGADGGVDIVLTRGREKHFVQCKRWRAQRVGVDVVRELYVAMAANGAVGGFVVTSGRFTPDAEAFAQGRNIDLIGGRMLHAMLQAAHGLVAAPAAMAAQRTVSPACPQCGRAMVKRVARQGANSGSSFWGCTGFPSCRGTRAIDDQLARGDG